MPTPFYHLWIASDLLKILAGPPAQRNHPDRARSWLEEQRCAFLLGNTAPDVQVISGQSREATHFFRLPVEDNPLPPWRVLLKTHPTLSRPEKLPPDHSAFLAGYLCHLLADWLWIKQIYAPIFGPDCTWDTFPNRLYLHNVLRASLDSQVLLELPEGTAACLEEIQPRSWLPFVQDASLVQWRNFISQQLQPGAAIQTVEVFAGRQKISPEEFRSLLNSHERLEGEVFSRIPRRRLEAYRRQLLSESQCLVHAYLDYTLGGRPGSQLPAPLTKTRLQIRR